MPKRKSGVIRKALEHLAACTDGVTERMLMYQGFDLTVFRALVEQGLARTQTHNHANPPGLVVIRYWITRLGQDVLEIKHGP